MPTKRDVQLQMHRDFTLVVTQNFGVFDKFSPDLER